MNAKLKTMLILLFCALFSLSSLAVLIISFLRILFFGFLIKETTISYLHGPERGIVVWHHGNNNGNREESVIGYQSVPRNPRPSDIVFRHFQERLVADLPTLPDYQKMTFEFRLLDQHRDYHTDRPCISVYLNVNTARTEVAHVIFTGKTVVPGSERSLGEFMAEYALFEMKQKLKSRY